MFLSVRRICEETGLDNHTVYRLAGREKDPLPLRYLEGQRRTGFCIEDELGEWVKRNTVSYRDRRK